MPKFHEGINAILTTIMLRRFAELENLVNCSTIRNLKLKKSSTNHINFII